MNDAPESHRQPDQTTSDPVRIRLSRRGEQTNDRLSPVLRTHLTLRERADEMVWLRLGAVPRLALRPERMLVGIISVALAFLVLRATAMVPGARDTIDSVTDTVATATTGMGSDLLSFDRSALSMRLWALIVEIPRQVAQHAPVSGICCLVALAGIWALGGATISRSASLEFGRSEQAGLIPCTAFAAGRFGHTWGGLLIPFVFPLLALLIIAGVYNLLFRVPVLDLVGGLFYGLAMLVGIVGLVSILAGVCAIPLAPAVSACQKGDVFEIAQRGMAYVIRKPVATLASLLAVTLAGIVTAYLVWLVVWLGSQTAFWITGAPSGHNAPDNTVSMLVGIWETAPAAITAGYCVSYASCAGSVLYLILRKVIDGQSLSSIANA